MQQDIIKMIAQSGLRILNRTDMLVIIENMGLSKTYISRMLNLMTQNGSLVSYGNGLYTLPVELLSGGPIHTYEIALKLAKKGAISHRSAFSYYELSDQVFSKVYVTVPKEAGSNLSRTKEYDINGAKYNLIRISPQHFWGHKNVFIGEAKILITDLERTLIDGLSNPGYCGGFREVLYGFEKAIDQVSSSKLYEYVKKTTLANCKRLGYILESLDQYRDIQEMLKNLPMPYYQKLDQEGARSGKHNARWNLIENI